MAEQEPMILDVAECDGLDVLRRVRTQYYRQANRIAHRRTDPETGILPEKYHSVIEWYRTQGDLVGNLIPEDKHEEGVQAVSEGIQSNGEAGEASQEGNISHHLAKAVGHHEPENGEVHYEEPATTLPRESPTETEKEIV